MKSSHQDTLGRKANEGYLTGAPGAHIFRDRAYRLPLQRSKPESYHATDLLRDYRASVLQQSDGNTGIGEAYWSWLFGSAYRSKDQGAPQSLVDLPMPSDKIQRLPLSLPASTQKCFGLYGKSRKNRCILFFHDPVSWSGGRVGCLKTLEYLTCNTRKSSRVELFNANYEYELRASGLAIFHLRLCVSSERTLNPDRALTTANT